MEKLPTGYSYCKASNKHTDIAKSIIFGILEEYGLIPENPDLDEDLNDIESNYKGGYFGLIVNELDEIVGTFALHKTNNQIAEIRKMYLLKEARKKGIGKWMLSFLFQKAKTLGFRKVQLLTASPLTEAINLYKSKNFIEMKSPKPGPRCDKAYYKMLY